MSSRGPLCVRVNATGTGIRYRHEGTEEAGDGGFTIRYLDGPKTGLQIHSFTAAELTGLTRNDFSPLMPLRLDSTPQVPSAKGQWSQWEAIRQRRHTVIENQHAGRAASHPPAAGATPGGAAP
jgi:hypothetical protein